MQVAVDTGDANFERVARDMEEIAMKQTTPVIEADSPAVAAIRFQKEIFKAVESQLKEARILKVAAMNNPEPRHFHDRAFGPL